MECLPVRRYDGKVLQVVTPQDVEQALEDFRQESVVGLDTETQPAFRKGECYLPCLVQAATARAAYLFQLRRPGAYPALAAMLEDPRIVKVGVSLANDLRPLKQVFAFDEKNTLDLGIVARRRGLGQTGVRNLAGIFLGFRIPKGARTSNWAAAELTPQQVTYAATDAWACRELYLRFRDLGMLSARADR